MTAPVETKTIRVSATLHRRIMTLAAERNLTADEAIAELYSPSTVVVPLTRVQHGRWKAQATELGVSLPQFIKLRVESTIGGLDSNLIEKTFYTVRALAQYHGISAKQGVQQSTDDLQP